MQRRHCIYGQVWLGARWGSSWSLVEVPLPQSHLAKSSAEKGFIPKFVVSYSIQHHE
eukprot:c20485_g1_i1 orf=2-169(-)